MKALSFLMASVAVAAFTSPVSAFAQTAPQTTPDTAATPGTAAQTNLPQDTAATAGDGDTAPIDRATSGGDDIVVTARRREENAQKVPISVTAFSAATLQRNGVQNFNDLSLNNPNVKITSFNGNSVVASNVAIRGNVQSATVLTVDPSVGTYQDGLIIAHTFGTAGLTTDVESVQTLKGPQGTLFGRNTTGGALLVATRNPDLKGVNGYAQAELGELNTRNFTAAVNVPLSEIAALRVVYDNRYRGNYQSLSDGRKLGRENDEVFRAKLLVEPFDGTSILLSAEKVTQEGTSTINVIQQPNAPDYKNTPANVSGNPLSDPRSGERARVTAQHYGAIVSQDVGAGQIKLLVGHRAYTIRSFTTLPPLLGYTRQDKPGNKDTSVELQYNASFLDDRLKLTSGLYYFDETVNEFQETFCYVAGPPVCVNRATTPATNFPDNQQAYRFLTMHTKSKSAYAQSTFAVTDALNVTLGVRYTDDKKTASLLNGRTRATATLAGYDAKQDRFNYLATIDYSPAQDVMFYVSTASGYRSGGPGVDIDPRDPTRTSTTSFLAESVKNYEAGFKTQLFDRKLRFNGAAFHQVYSDYQYTAVLPVNGVPTRVTQNADARIDGFETDASLRLGAGTSIYGGVGFINARVRQPGGPEDDVKLSNVPRLTWNVGATHDVAIGEGNLNLTVNYSWRDKYSTTLATRSDPRDEELASRIDSLGLLNASATYKLGEFSIGVFANNLTNEKYYGFISESPPLLRFGGLGLPRVIGARTRFEF